ncbi:tRNA (adenosine(37)-N6)-dimethylallyltransferase MiaA [Parvibaculum sp.]|uniref:tRNA (adenosine(37)-N6)-dimethylallyltransferase MiaA n=1 Tax=Parvibaculum sp. TaxID=2024848 RepID=UPI001D8F85EE|nr:tRNA (adenosine(37)-N6)-dimethylallyltransferase MiaA [Parvibaculum sp.]MBX3488553.1 tRNA (adenosine(37)-N6)-dimethylallyltransferase MiaA [Parvibaculum sp.]MCW5727519.1 tRNA (adenosine(37)-N6)-dimethylallyltransferase MiaA [Parvibaculum sp.]
MSVDVGRAVLIAGPTASGKSALALALAGRLGGEIVNADSMQLYREMRVLTARPSAVEEALFPHHLYGVQAADAPLSAGRWAVRAAQVMGEIAGRDHVPIVVGGTGLYFRALVEGLAPIPAIPAELRRAVREEVAAAGEGAHALLAAADPALAATIRPSDRQRIARGIEVARATGRPLSEWQQVPPVPLVAGRFAKIVLMPDREVLRARADARFERMVAEGALAEAAAMAALDLDPALPAMKALGLRPLMAHLAGALLIEEAIAAGQAETRAYAKRQETWMRTQMIAWKPFHTQFSESVNAEIFSFIDDLGLTRS